MKFKIGDKVETPGQIRNIHLFFSDICRFEFDPPVDIEIKGIIVQIDESPKYRTPYQVDFERGIGKIWCKEKDIKEA